MIEFERTAKFLPGFLHDRYPIYAQAPTRPSAAGIRVDKADA